MPAVTKESDLCKMSLSHLPDNSFITPVALRSQFNTVPTTICQEGAGTRGEIHHGFVCLLVLTTK